MAEKLLRFGIHDGKSLCASTWKLFTDNKSEIYLICRPLGNMVKVSLHESGYWHIAYSESFFKEKVNGKDDRFITKWERPKEIGPDITIAMRIITPSRAVAEPIKESDKKKIKWIKNAPIDRATEIDIFISEPKSKCTGWPGKRSMSTSLIGNLELNNGSNIWAVYREVEIPDLSSIGDKRGRFYKGKTKEDLKSNNLRLLTWDIEPDGSIALYDCKVESL